ncbi:uncharacterized protein LOC142353905 isoform X2 [Convolutriloba macropyga]|uniref:uncharacterized protein LOC142353905 isoform X2 n=1 Tax=Convolutriloba macropyga TaxID=536237 RepID=UPI003F521809
MSQVLTFAVTITIAISCFFNFGSAAIPSLSWVSKDSSSRVSPVSLGLGVPVFMGTSASDPATDIDRRAFMVKRNSVEDPNFTRGLFMSPDASWGNQPVPQWMSVKRLGAKSHFSPSFGKRMTFAPSFGKRQPSPALFQSGRGQTVGVQGSASEKKRMARKEFYPSFGKRNLVNFMENQAKPFPFQVNRK